MFDTNAVFEKDSQTILSAATVSAVRDHSRHGDLDVLWSIPEVVRFEREFQLRDTYRGVAAHVQKAERLFGADWGISEETLNRRVSLAIDAELDGLNVSVQESDPAKVDWTALTHRACFRLPPFERGQKEKGFRDAIICETFLQLVATLSGSDAAVLVTDDQLIRAALEERPKELKGARIVPNIEALRDEINLRVSLVDAATASEIERKGAIAFINGDDPRSLWIRGNLYTTVWSKFGDQIKKLPSAVGVYEMEKHEVAPPRLVSKEGSRVQFSSIYSVYSAALYWVPDPPQGEMRSANPTGLINAHLGIGAPQVGALPTGLLSGLAGRSVKVPAPQPDTFEILWSATYGRSKRLTHIQLDSVERAKRSGDEVRNELANALLRFTDSGSPRN